MNFANVLKLRLERGWLILGVILSPHLACSGGGVNVNPGVGKGSPFGLNKGGSRDGSSEERRSETPAILKKGSPSNSDTASGEVAESAPADLPESIAGSFLTVYCTNLPSDVADRATFACGVYEKESGKKYASGSGLGDWSLSPREGASNGAWQQLTDIKSAPLPELWDVIFRMPAAEANGAVVRVAVKNYADPHDAVIGTKLRIDQQGTPKGFGLHSGRLFKVGSDNVVPPNCEGATIQPSAVKRDYVRLRFDVKSDQASIRVVALDICGGYLTDPDPLKAPVLRVVDPRFLIPDKGHFVGTVGAGQTATTGWVALPKGEYRVEFGRSKDSNRDEATMAFGSLIVIPESGTVVVDAKPIDE